MLRPKFVPYSAIQSSARVTHVHQAGSVIGIETTDGTLRLPVIGQSNDQTDALIAHRETPMLAAAWGSETRQLPSSPSTAVAFSRPKPPSISEKSRGAAPAKALATVVLASFQVPDARMILITPYDKSAMNGIEKSIRDSDLGVNPSNDGISIRVSLPNG